MISWIWHQKHKLKKKSGNVPHEIASAQHSNPQSEKVAHRIGEIFENHISAKTSN
jgi:hypothetical protein